MTKEEAIDILLGFQEPEVWEKPITEEAFEALAMGIDALDKQRLKWDGQTKTTKKLTFTLNYADGTSAEIDEGVLFSVNADGTMDIHIGVDKAWKLFGVARCLAACIESLGLGEKFRRYLQEDFGDGQK